MKKIVFEGPLAEAYPNGIDLHAKTAFEALTLLQNFPEFKLDSGNLFKVTLPQFQSQDVLHQPTKEEVIRVVQIVEDKEAYSGQGGRGGVLQIVIGVIIIVANFLTFKNPYVFQVGIGLILGGVIQLLMPQPEKNSSDSQEKSNYLAANKNTVKIGTVIPLLFGRAQVFGHFLSYNVTATNLSTPGGDGIPSGEGVSSGRAGGILHLVGGAVSPPPVIYAGDWIQFDGS